MNDNHEHEYIWVDKKSDLECPSLGEHEYCYFDLDIFRCKECGKLKVSEF